MGSDSCSTFGPPPVAGNNFSISVAGESREHCDDIFAKLSEGGMVKMPMHETFWGAYFGNWTDRFGIDWRSISSCRRSRPVPPTHARLSAAHPD